MRRSLGLALYLMLPALLSGCNGGIDPYTLYRNSVVRDEARIHVATFDAADGGAYNRDNCELAANLFQAQSGVRTRFWCERGRFSR